MEAQVSSRFERGAHVRGICPHQPPRRQQIKPALVAAGNVLDPADQAALSGWANEECQKHSAMLVACCLEPLNSAASSADGKLRI
jgi:hypothetical protein